MPEIIAALDENGANDLLTGAIAMLGTVARSGTDALGPFNVGWNASATFSNGTVDLRTPDIIRIADLRMDFTVGFSISFDLSSILPDFCLPRICIWTPWGDVCTPRICVDWPTITIPVSHSDFVRVTGDFRLDIRLDSGDWVVDVVLVGLPVLQLGLASSALVTAIGLAVSAALLLVPFIGPFLAAAAAAISVAIGIAAVTGLLGAILTPFISGLSFNIYRQPQMFEVLPAGGPIDPVVRIRIDTLTARVDSTDEDELVLAADVTG